MNHWQMDDPREIFAQTIELWKPTGYQAFDTKLIDLIQTGFFKQYLRSTEQMLVILDQQTMKYLHLSDNFLAITGHPKQKLSEEGVAYTMNYFHPDDVMKFSVITKTLQDTFARLTKSELLQCGFSYDYRFAYRDGSYHHLLQHNIPLTVDDHRSIAHVLVILTDISAYKRDLNCSYRVVLHPEGDLPRVLAKGSVGEGPVERITGRERDIIELTAEGLTEKAIADKLNISLYTVKTHRRNLFRKTGVKNAIELVKFCSANLMI